jgi:hypothetical protein
MRLAVLALVLLATPAAATPSSLTFDIAKLCQWQHDNNSMAIAECTRLEQEAQQTLPALASAADKERLDACETEAKSFSGDSGFASYTVYAACLKDGPGNP